MMQEETGQEVEEYIPGTLDEFVTYHAVTIRKTAERKHQRQGFCEVDDIEQAIFEYTLKNWRNLEGSDEKKARAVFGRVADQYLARERQDYMYFTGAYIYSPSNVRSILEQSAWSMIEEAPDVEGRVDIRAGFEQLPPKQKQAVFERYALKITPEEQGEAMKRNTQRGVDGITHYLNKQAGSPRTYTMDELRQKLAKQL